MENKNSGKLDLERIRAVALDVDGVLTDGGVWWGPNGEEWKRFCFADIMGVSLARRAGLELALISGEDSPLVDRYAAKMHIHHIFKGCLLHGRRRERSGGHAHSRSLRGPGQRRARRAGRG
jgi:phosphoserine phosphatase